MPDFKEILGNEVLKEHFRTAIKQNKVSHAYILEGEKGSGKKMIAAAFAKILQCEERLRQSEGLVSESAEDTVIQKDTIRREDTGRNSGDYLEACGSCASCIQIEHKNHPDVIWVSHEKPGVISVSEIREQVVNTMDVMPYKGPYKIYIVDEAEKMNLAAQNAILKTIEEPPGYGIILLLTTNRGAFLPTILSRCILLTVKPVDDNSIREYLTGRLHVSERTADFCVGFSMGNLGKATDAALSEDFEELRQFSISVLQYIHEAEPYELTQRVKEMKKWKESVGDFLDILLMWFRDVLVLKLTGEEAEIIFHDAYPFLKKQSGLLSFEALNEIFLEIEKTRARIRANVNYDTSLEVLLLLIRNKYQIGK
ncbi:MAG: DNA polymerase III subunit [Clostridiales bacterium]|nr:DNA polymerase III subunit [Clostridiales bacterium]